MTRAYYSVPCPTCGRRLEIRVNLMGKRVACRHCQGQFEARDPDQQTADDVLVSEFGLLDRANELLAILSQRQTTTP